MYFVYTEYQVLEMAHGIDTRNVVVYNPKSKIQIQHLTFRRLFLTVEKIQSSPLLLRRFPRVVPSAYLLQQHCSVRLGYLPPRGERGEEGDINFRLNLDSLEQASPCGFIQQSARANWHGREDSVICIFWSCSGSVVYYFVSTCYPRRTYGAIGWGRGAPTGLLYSATAILLQ